MRLNTSTAIPRIHTHEGATAKRITPEQQLRRSVLSCLLWEKEAYEDGQKIADRILEAAAKVDANTVSALAVEARNVHGLRHVPLLLLTDLIRRGGSGVADAVASTIRRADEMAELLQMYWKDGKRPLSKQLQKGLAKAIGKFSEYQLAKYDRDGPVRLRDVLFLSHAKPRDDEQAALFKRIAERQLETPDTWEVSLSGGADKKETFGRLLQEGKLGYLALLRNLRNMVEAGVDRGQIRDAIVARKGADLVLPFRYVAAARACPQLEPAIDQALCAAVAAAPKLSGRTVVLVDVSGSMDEPLSSKSDLKRIDAASALASVISADDLRVFSFSSRGIVKVMDQYGWQRGWGHDGKTPVLVEVPARRGMAGVDAVIRSQEHQGTFLGLAIKEANAIPHDRLIVITDEQSADKVPDPVAKHAYMINVASNRNGVGYGRWIHIDGFSESVIRFIHEIEAEPAQAESLAT
jgi:hypothetical protein